MPHTVVVPLWRGSKELPSYSYNRYTEVDAARLRCLVHRNLRGLDHNFLIMCDEYYFDKIAHIQANLEECVAGFMEPDRYASITPEQESADGPPYIVVRPSAINWLAGVDLVQFSGNDPGGWSRIMEAFYVRPEPGYRHVMMGLDTIPIGDLSWLFKWNKAPVGLPRDPFYPKVPCNAVISYNDMGADILLDAYKSALPSRMSKFMLGKSPSEMLLMRSVWADNGWPYLEDGKDQKLLSYKAHIAKTRGPYIKDQFDTSKASLVYFHGEPKPGSLSRTSQLGSVWNSV